MMTQRAVAVALAISALAIPTLSFAQSERGSITGIVTDGTKGALPGVAVKVINTATNVATNLVSSDSGSYTAANLPPGLYKVEATLQGFKMATVDEVRVTAGGSARVDVSMDLGSMAESVNVVAENAAIETENAKVSTNVSNQLIDELPLVVGGAMRSPFDLIATVPEARGTGQAALGGGQGGAFGATLDGISVNTNRNADTTETAFLTPSLEAITEFAVETNGFKPEFGQAGGGSITFASKSGTNTFQGSLYEFHRNDAFDSRSFFEAKKGIYKQNDYGGSVGGPVRLGGMYNGTNRTFFFASYEGFVNRAGSNAAFRSVPTPEMLNGDFSNWVNSSGQLLTIYDPATTRANPNGTGFIRDPFPGNKIPLERFSSVARQYLALLRSTGIAPNRPGLVPGTFAYVNTNYVSEGRSSIEKTNKYSIKIDHNLSNAHRVSYVFNRTNNGTEPGPNGASGLPAPFSDFSRSTFDGDLHRANWDWVRATMVNNLTVGANTFNKNAYSPNVDQNWKSKVCIPNAVDCNQNFGAITFAGTELSSWGATSYNGTKQPRFTVKDDVTMIRGSHSFKSGFTYDRQQANGFGQQDYGGRSGFSFRQTGLPGNTNFVSGSSFASFLLGWADSGRTETIRYLQQIYRYYGFYAQDDWRMNDKLVLNYGLRYEFTQPPVAGGDQYSDLDPTLTNPVTNSPGALIFAGNGPGRQGKRSLIPAYFGSVAPRLSAAYSLNDKTTVRGGVGRSFGRVTVVAGTSHFAGFIGQYPFSNGDSGLTATFLLDQGLPAYPLPPQINPAFSNNSDIDYWNGKEALRPAQYDTWTMSLQRELRKGLSVEVDYNGSKGSHLQANLLNLNQVPLAKVNDLIARFGAAGAVALLNSNITSATAVAAGITAPYPAFLTAAQNTKSVAQALRPFPQYNSVTTTTGGGDKTGRSMYHAAVVKMNARMSSLLLQGSYTYSHLMTNADTFSGSTGSMDTAQPDLEYSIGSLDQPHSVKLSTVWTLPFGADRRWLRSGVANQILGGWRIAAVQNYTTGFPLAVTTGAAPLPIFNGTNRPNIVPGVDWQAPFAGDKFDPNVDKYLNRAAFSAPVGQLGNAPRRNGDIRRPWNLTENVSVAKTITVSTRMRVDVRAEAFNLFNRIVWGAPVTDFNNANFGSITTLGNSPRQMQFGLRLYW